MTPKQLNTLKKLGIDPDKSEEDILHDLINLADWLYDELEREESIKFIREIRRLIKRPSN